MEFERQGFDVERADWPDLRVPEDRWRSQWCHGAVGIGLARLGMLKRGADTSAAMAVDIEHALASANRGWPGHVDTLCCGAVGSVELFREAAKVLNRDDYAVFSVASPLGDRARSGIGGRLSLQRHSAAVQSGPVSWTCRRRVHLSTGT